MRLELRELSHAYRGSQVLKHFELDVEFSGPLILLGTSGAGKSTLLRLLCGLEVPSRGQIIWNERPLPQNLTALQKHRQQVGVVFQDSNLFPHLNVLENVLLPLEKVHGCSRPEALVRARQELARFHVLRQASSLPWQLSGGQRQRVALARALAVGAQAILLDEPTSALDPEMTWEVLQAVESLLQEGCPIVLSTHEVAIAHRLGGKALFLAEGRLVEWGPTRQLLERPQSSLLKNYLSKVLVSPHS